jgi:hypothetical protein
MTKLLLLIALSVLLPGSISGQEPPIGIVDFYGLRSLSERQARQALRIKEGDPAPASREEAQRRLEALPNVQQARLNTVCCEAGKTMLYVGIREKGAPSLQFRPAPKGSVRLPEAMLRAGDAFWDAVQEGLLKDLVYGMSDPDGDVRNVSTRSLAVLAGFAQRSPGRRIEVPVEPFIDMLNSIVWTDRNKSSMALLHLTEKRDPAVLSKLRERALPSLVEMSRWKSRGHASAPFFLQGRAGNLPEEEIFKYWNGDDREGLIEAVLRKVKSK